MLNKSQFCSEHPFWIRCKVFVTSCINKITFRKYFLERVVPMILGLLSQENSFYVATSSPTKTRRIQRHG